MTLIELNRSIVNDYDSGIYYFLEKAIGEQHMVKRFSEMILLIIKEYSNNNQDIINTKQTLQTINEDSFGGIGVATLIAMMNSYFNKMEPNADYTYYVQTCSIAVAAYLRKEIYKSEFVEALWKFEKNHGLSDKFCDNLVDYFGSKSSLIVSEIKNKL